MCVCVFYVSMLTSREKEEALFSKRSGVPSRENIWSTIRNEALLAGTKHPIWKGTREQTQTIEDQKITFSMIFFPPFRFPSSLMPFLPRFYSFHDALGFRCIRGLSFSYLSIVPLSVSVSFSVSLGKEKPIPFVSRPTSWLFDFDFQLIIKQTAPSPLTWKLKRPIPCATWSIDMKTGTGYYDNKKSRLLCLFSSFKVENK